MSEVEKEEEEEEALMRLEKMKKEEALMILENLKKEEVALMQLEKMNDSPQSGAASSANVPFELL